MNDVSEDIFNILKGAKYKLRLFTEQGKKTLNPEEAHRFYAYDQDLMVTIRKEDTDFEILVQAGKDYDVISNKDLLNSIKKVAHNSLGEYTVRNFDKNITPKDFAHQVSEGFSKPFGSVKTSYIQSPNAKLIIRHSKGVNEEVRGARSRNIHSLFIENAHGERFKFPYRYMAGAKAMTKHVNEGGTPYDEKGKSILSLCEEIADLNMFVRHVKSNNLVNENNSDIVEAITKTLVAHKNTIKSLSTQRGYNNFKIQEEIEDQKEVDITEKFLYNTFNTEEIKRVLPKVGRIVSVLEGKANMETELLQKLLDMINNKEDFKISYSADDPEHPNNQNPKKWEGPEGKKAKLVDMLTFLSYKTKNDNLFNVLAQLGGDAHYVFNMNPKRVELLDNMVRHIIKYSDVKSSQPKESLDESVLLELRQKINQ